MLSFPFWRAGARAWRTLGAIAPSSAFLAKAIVRDLKSHQPRVVVELGPGDGAITKYILDALPANGKLICFEINDTFCSALRQKFANDPRFILIQESAEMLERVLSQSGYYHADAIISSLPFMVLPEALRNNILTAGKKVLTTNGYFIQFHYSPFLKQCYESYFQEVRVRFVPMNIPPAFVFFCRS